MLQWTFDRQIRINLMKGEQAFKACKFYAKIRAKGRRTVYSGNCQSSRLMGAKGVGGAYQEMSLEKSPETSSENSCELIQRDFVLKALDSLGGFISDMNWLFLRFFQYLRPREFRSSLVNVRDETAQWTLQMISLSLSMASYSWLGSWCSDLQVISCLFVHQVYFIRIG